MNNLSLTKLPFKVYFNYMGLPHMRYAYGFSFSPRRRVFYIRTLNSNNKCVTQSYNVSELSNLEVAFNV